MFNSDCPPKSQPRRRRRAYASIRLLESSAADVFAARGHSARKLGEVHKVASDVGERFDNPLIDHAAQFCAGGLNQRLLLLSDLNGLVHVSDLHCHVLDNSAADGQNQAALDCGLESRALSAEFILSGPQIRKTVATLAVVCGVADNPGLSVLNADFCPRDDSAGCISDHAGQRCRGGLPQRGHAGEQRYERRQ